MIDNNPPLKPNSKAMGIMAIIAVIFGMVTLYSGGEVLFIDGAGRARAGNYLNVIVWFNFIAGFVYIITGYMLYKQKPFALMLSKAIAIGTLIAFIGLGIYVYSGGAYEDRTIFAMILRFSIWFIIVYFTSKYFKAIIALNGIKK